MPRKSLFFKENCCNQAMDRVYLMAIGNIWEGGSENSDAAADRSSIRRFHRLRPRGSLREKSTRCSTHSRSRRLPPRPKCDAPFGPLPEGQLGRDRKSVVQG